MPYGIGRSIWMLGGEKYGVYASISAALELIKKGE